MAKLNIHRLIEAAQEKAPVAQSFLTDLKIAIEKYDQLNSRKPSKSYKPSSMSCIRIMYFQIIGEEKDPGRSSYQLIGMGNSGSSRHDQLQEVISNMTLFNMDCEYINVADFVKERKLDYLEIVKQQGHETKLYNKDLNISFLCDGIIKYKGKYYVLEIKTESTYKFGPRVDVAFEHHIQGTAYSMNLGLDSVIFLYENRDCCDLKTYEFVVSEQMKLDVIAKIELCDTYVSKLIPPPFPIDISKKTCSYCNYRHACKKAGK